MVYVALLLFGLMLGSFVNALVWRVHEQELIADSSELRGKKLQATSSKLSAPSSKLQDLSITKGRSMCPHCRHELSALDLIPVLSWVTLGGRCRYCKAPISAQYPLVELATAALFVLSYMFWPVSVNTLPEIINFVGWLLILTGFVALFIYDVKWMLLPNRILYPLIGLAAALALLNILRTPSGTQIWHLCASLLIAGGLFWGLFEASGGRWIGGGDVKLGILIGFLVADPYKAFLVLFLASILGTLVILPGMLAKKLTAKSQVPFGPFLIAATVLVQLFGDHLINWYQSLLIR